MLKILKIKVINIIMRFTNENKKYIYKNDI